MIKRDSTIQDLLDEAERMNSAVTQIIGRDKNNVPTWAVIAVRGEDTWKYLLAADALAIEDEGIHEDVLQDLRAALEAE